MRASSAICPAPRIAISSTSTSVSAGALRIVSGSPISVFQFCGVATVRRCGRSIPESRALVDVLPVEPVMPITSAPSSRRHAVARRWRADSGSSAVRTVPWAGACSGATRTPHAPPSSARSANAPPSTFSPRSPTNRSPSPASRESMTARRGPSAVVERSSRAPAASATRSGDQARTQRLPRHRRVVERDLVPVRELLALLVALAGDDDDIAVGGQRDRLLDRRAPVDLDAHVVAVDAGDDLGHDRLGVLGARIVAGDEHLVGQPGGDLAHDRALAAVAVAAGAEDDDDPPRGELAGGPQDVLQRV